jgi:hypothetical protein
MSRRLTSQTTMEARAVSLMAQTHGTKPTTATNAASTVVSFPDRLTAKGRLLRALTLVPKRDSGR